MAKLQLEVTLRKNETGEVRVFKCVDDDQFKDAIVFSWTENNFSCDCNRSLFWSDYSDEDENEDDEYPCGDTKFTLLKLYLPELGETLYEELHDQSGV
jgi:hypothetical protein